MSTITVKATQLGYHGLKRRKVGDVFKLEPIETVDTETGLKKIITAEKQFSRRWMQKVEEPSAPMSATAPAPAVESSPVLAPIPEAAPASASQLYYPTPEAEAEAKAKAEAEAKAKGKTKAKAKAKAAK